MLHSYSLVKAHKTKIMKYENIGWIFKLNYFCLSLNITNILTLMNKRFCVIAVLLYRCSFDIGDLWHICSSFVNIMVDKVWYTWLVSCLVCGLTSDTHFWREQRLPVY